MNSKMFSPDGRFKGILFGDLFNIYNSISNKVRFTRSDNKTLIDTDLDIAVTSTSSK